MVDLSAQVIKQDQLTDSDKLEMYELYSSYYAECDLDSFTQDMNEKDYIILLHQPSGVICGFSTLLLIDFTHNKEQCLALYSGDTIIHHNYWGSQTLLLSWCQLAGAIKNQHPDTPLYWFLIVKGYRTYRYLPLFTKKFYPTWRQQTPVDTQLIMHRLAKLKFSSNYSADRGLIQFARSQGHLSGEWADIPPHVMTNRDVKYFLQKNPGYTKGDELVCLTELSESNLRSYALRAFKQPITL